MIDAIRTEADRQGLTRAELARRCGWEGRAGWQRVHDYLNGRNTPPQPALEALAEAVGCRWVLTPDKRYAAHRRERP